MPRLLLALLLLSAPAFAQPLPQSAWSAKFDEGGEYKIDATGSLLEPDGATVAFTCTKTSVNGVAIAVTSIPAETLRMRRITLSGELQTGAGSGTASLFIRALGDNGPLFSDHGIELDLPANTAWTARTVVVPVPDDTKTIEAGVRLRDTGSMNARHVRLTIGDALAPAAKIAPEAKRVLDAGIRIVRKNAFRSGQVDWPKAEPRVRALAGGATTSAETYPAIRYLLTQLGDHHSFFLPPAGTKDFQTAGAKNPGPEVRGAAGDVGYIDVPGYFGIDEAAMRAYSKRMHAAFLATMPSAPCGWIVDLRHNDGGNMWPMLDGLQPLLGRGPLGYFIGSSGDLDDPWIAGTGVNVNAPRALRKLETAPVAVLTGPVTASSGEIVAIAFRGRAHTRSFGEPTAGVSTANENYSLPDGSTLFLTMAVDADRNGRMYGDKVAPDEPTSGDDKTMAAATAWLRGESPCGATSARSSSR